MDVGEGCGSPRARDVKNVKLAERGSILMGYGNELMLLMSLRSNTGPRVECTSFSVGDPASYLGTIWINYHKKHQAMVGLMV